MKLIMRNEKGLFNVFSRTLVSSKVGVENLEKMLSGTLPCPFNDEEKGKVQTFIDLVKTLPTETHHITLKKNDSALNYQPPNASKHAPYGWASREAYYFMVLAGNFKVDRQVMDYKLSLDEIRETWTTIKKMSAIAGLNEILSKAEITFYHANMPRALRYEKQSKNWTFEVEDLGSELSSATAYAVYSEEDGFLNQKGNFTKALSAARYFESAEAARRTISSRRIGDAVVVELETNLSKLVELPNLPFPSEMNEIRLGLASSEKRSLQKALEKEEIKLKLDLLEKMQQEHPEWFEENQPQSSSTPKRRL